MLVMSRGVEELFAAELIARTREELAAAHSIIGVKTTTFLDFPAPQLDSIPVHQLADAVLGQLRRSSRMSCTFHITEISIATTKPRTGLPWWRRDPMATRVPPGFLAMKRCLRRSGAHPPAPRLSCPPCS